MNSAALLPLHQQEFPSTLSLLTETTHGPQQVMWVAHVTAFFLYNEQ